MRIRLTILLLCGILLAGTAMADVVPPGAQLIEFEKTQTIPGSVMRDGKLENLAEYEVRTYITKLLPLADGTKVVGGYVDYPGEYRNPYMSGYEDPDDMLRTEAYLACITAEGEIDWELRLADPQAHDVFRPLGSLPDGRILVLFIALDSTFGPKYFIVNTDGFVESMLDHRILSEAFSPMSLMLMPNGYLGGDSSIIDVHYNRHFNPYGGNDRTMTLLDYDLEPIWTLDMQEHGDFPTGYVGLGLSDGTLLYGTLFERSPDEVSRASAMKVNPDGSIAWHYTAGKEGYSSISGAVEMSDGVLLSANFRDPTMGRDVSRLIKLSSEGEELFTVDMHENERTKDIISIGQIVPMGEDFVLEGYMSGWDDYKFVHINAEGKVLGIMALSGEKDRSVHWHELTMGEDGKSYISGMVTEPRDEDSGRSGPPIEYFYRELTPDCFT